MSRLLLLFLITPVVELYLLIELGKVIGIGPTLALIVVTAVLGSSMARREGLSVWQRFQSSLQQGHLPGAELIDGLIILVSGALLLTPGVLTDFVGFLGLIPLTRGVIRKYALERVRRSMADGRLNVHFSGPMPPPYDRGDRPNDAGPVEPKEPLSDGGYETVFGGQARQRPSHTEREDD